jgi:hypothetical protein
MGPDRGIEVPGCRPAEDQDPLFLDQARQIGGHSERDRPRAVLDLDLAAGQEAVPVTQLLWNNDPSETIYCSFHSAPRQDGEVFSPILLPSGRS